MRGRQTVNALVTAYNRERKLYVACCSSIENDITIDERLLPSNIDFMATWISLVVRGDEAHEYIKIIDNLFETCVINGVVQVKAEASLVPKSDKRDIQMLHQTSNTPSFFGFICDPNGYVGTDNEDMDDFNSPHYLWVTPLRTKTSRWMVSGKQDMVYVNGCSYRIFEGVIHSDRPDNDQYIAWSKSKPNSEILVDYYNCPGRNYMVGSWIKMAIDENNCVVNTVTRVSDLCETRIREKVVELNVNLERISRDGEDVFYNFYFGYVNDPKQVFRDVSRNGSRYNAWISYNHFSNANERWGLAINQTISMQVPRANSTNRCNIDERGNQSNSPRDCDRSYSPHLADNSTHRADSRRMNPRSTTPLSRAETSDAETEDSDEEFYGLAPCISHMKVNEDGQKEAPSFSQQEMQQDDPSRNIPEKQGTQRSEPVQTSIHSHDLSQQEEIPKVIDNRAKRLKKERTPAELELLKLNWALATMKKSFSILSKNRDVSVACKQVNREGYGILMDIINEKTRLQN